MMRRHMPSKEAAGTVAASISSILLSVIASSHHWLHMGILLLLGGSANALASMTGILWIRRAMMVATVITTVFAFYRLMQRKHMPLWMKWLSALSIGVSVGFLGYTLVQFGW
ncbi:hypothetical protein RAC89_18110 [Paenibacillus sp. GD4]|uniref:hypothetical protein n=1 Tax=Paenibacillus sp. GD4 TaxID=3068890 RepID=UPI0027964E28|nr:hypothetical protein [Paenibacillus sp. GD4]MDQ1912307.1 hypothetical protein [Paenibacillus sp. GD4]